MPDDAPEGAHDADANRDPWTQASADYADEHAFRARASNEITWGIFNGGGPCDGALNGAVTPEPLSSGSAGQPL